MQTTQETRLQQDENTFDRAQLDKGQLDCSLDFLYTDYVVLFDVVSLRRAFKFSLTYHMSKIKLHRRLEEPLISPNRLRLLHPTV